MRCGRTLDQSLWLILRQLPGLHYRRFSSTRIARNMSDDLRPQYSTKALFLLTLVVGLNAAALSSRHWFFTPAFLITACVLISVLLMTRLGVRILTASKIGCLLLLAQFVLFGAVQSIYLLTFDRDRAIASFGLGNPLSAGIISCLIGIPYAIICFGVSCILGFVITRFMERRTKSNR
jgi:hypothetical protein